jgi:hypothetical protein
LIKDESADPRRMLYAGEYFRKKAVLPRINTEGKLLMSE